MNALFAQRRLAAAAVLVLAAILPAAANAADTFKVDPVHTQTMFSINHLGYSSVSGNFHDIKGVVQVDDKDSTKSSVDVTIGTTTVDTGVPKRDERLRGNEEACATGRIRPKGSVLSGTAFRPPRASERANPSEPTQRHRDAHRLKYFNSVLSALRR